MDNSTGIYESWARFPLAVGKIKTTGGVFSRERFIGA
jgi:hypothetical protein